VFGVTTEDVRPNDTSGDLLERLALAGAGLLVHTLDALEDGTVMGIAQPGDGVSLAPKITVEDARVDWTAPALRVDRVVRACTPVPGAWTTLRGKRVKLAPVQHTDVELAPGHLQDGLVGTATTAVRLTGVRPEGKGAMPAADWLRGLRLESGEVFE
jgi:methionyl-tRNA formyltransferase